MDLQVNDVHSALNPTTVSAVHCPQSLEALRAVVAEARDRGQRLAVAGGRHAMGGQQFASGGVLLDLRGLNRVLARDCERGLLHIEAGADWPAVIAATCTMNDPTGRRWAIRQKQTGVDAVTLGGSISANGHGRGLAMAPMGDDVEALTLVTADAQVLQLSRTEHPELFALVIGGYGLFGVIYSVVLRLAPRQRLRRLVDVIDLDDAVNAVFRRAAQGCLYGDFQFVIDQDDPQQFLRRGVLACYQPCADDEGASEVQSDLEPETWLRLLKLAHEDKARAFALYAQHYLGTHGQCYWSDTHQLSTYLPSYSEYLEAHRATGVQSVRESLVIGEHYVPHERLLDFMSAARSALRALGTEVIYGTIRSIRQDTSAFLPWADQHYVCVVFNLRTRHDPSGIAATAAAFRALTEASLALGGRFFLTYHRFADIQQVLRAYPRFPEFLARKRHYDPQELFCSDWYRHYRDALQALPEPSGAL